MFAPYTPIDRCVGKELTVRTGGENYTGMLAGTYVLSGMVMLVLTAMRGGGAEQHIPLANSVVTIRQDQ